MVCSKEAESGTWAADCPSFCNGVGRTIGAMMLVLLLGQQGWLLWCQRQAMFVRLLPSAVPMGRDLLLGSKG